MKKDVRGGRITLAAPAKVNLYLGVHTQKDERGYHLVDSVMAALALCDEVTVEAARDLRVVMEPGIDVPVERSNAWKAAVRLAGAFGVPARAHIHVRQRIPMCAGLGGSSSDAGATLRGLCALWGIDVADPRVAAVARGIGADVPFFLDPRPSHLVGGGDVLAETFAGLPPLSVVLVKPGAGVSTVESYRDFDRDPVPEGDLEALLAALRALPAEGDRHADENDWHAAEDDRCTAEDDRRAAAASVLAHASNNLDPVACRLLPADAEIKAWLAAQSGTSSVLVTGSGSCVFAVADTPARAESIAADARARGWWSCATEFAGAARDEVC